MGSVTVKKYCTRIIGLGFTALLLSSCASQPEELQAGYTSDIRYQDWACRNLALEATSIDKRISELHGQLKKKAGDDQAQMAIGLILFWPALFFLEGGDGPQASEFSRLKGERDAIDRVSRFKDCSAVPVMPQPSGKQADVYEKLKSLKRMKDDGLISQSEYQDKRTALLKTL
jgi:hypothetical protein